MPPSHDQKSMNHPSPGTKISGPIPQVQLSGNGRPQRGMGHARGNSRCWTHGFCKHVRGSVVPKENKKEPTESVCNQNTQRQRGQRSANNQEHQHATISFFLPPCDGHSAIAHCRETNPEPLWEQPSSRKVFSLDCIDLARDNLIAS